MFQTLIVGFGRSGLGLHWSVLRRLRENPEGRRLFSDAPAVAHDIADISTAARQHGLLPAASLAEARELCDPATTVVHVCTPPQGRLETVRRLAELGYTRMIVEKPLAAGPDDLRALVRLREERGLRVVVVAHWLDSALTIRLGALIRAGGLGRLRSISVVQNKPRVLRTLRSSGHPTAFDVELPHSVGVALRLAGGATVTDAALGDMRVDGVTIPYMGRARLVLAHENGVRTEIASDLAAPVRERRITLTFDDGRAVGHYPISKEDPYAHLDVATHGAHGAHRSAIFRDDSLERFLLRAYRDLARDADLDPEFRLNARVTELVTEAKRVVGLADAARTRPEELVGHAG